MTNVLTPHQAAVATRVLDEESVARRHVVVSLSGAHAYGFPSPDSDLDLKAIHVEPTARLLALSPPVLHADRVEILDGVEVDYTSNELHHVLVGILGGNGNYIERVLGHLPLRASPEIDELRPLVAGALSRRVHRHYHGFATGQLRDFEAAEAPTAKKVLYVLRTTLTGIHLLRSAQLVTDVTRLLDEYGFGAARELIERKRSGERVVLDGATRDHWVGEVARAFALLDEARDRSPLPEECPNRPAVEEWLATVRRRLH
jgi:predicted nucleotidyltransferase